MNNRLASYLHEKFHSGNQHNRFCMKHLISDPMVKKEWGDSFSVQCVYNSVNVYRSYTIFKEYISVTTYPISKT